MTPRHRWAHDRTSGTCLRCWLQYRGVHTYVHRRVSTRIREYRRRDSPWVRSATVPICEPEA